MAAAREQLGKRVPATTDTHGTEERSFLRGPYRNVIRRQEAAVVQNHEDEHVRSLGKGEASHRKYKTLKLGGGQAYDRSSD
jgi:hypothetical protein